MRKNLQRLFALALVLVMALGLVPAVSADQDVRIRETAYSETQGLRAAMSGKVEDTSAFSLTGPEGSLTITEVSAGEKNIYTIVTAEHRRDLRLHPDLWRRQQGGADAHLVFHRRF